MGVWKYGHNFRAEHFIHKPHEQVPSHG